MTPSNQETDFFFFVLWLTFDKMELNNFMYQTTPSMIQIENSNVKHDEPIQLKLPTYIF